MRVKLFISSKYIKKELAPMKKILATLFMLPLIYTQAVAQTNEIGGYQIDGAVIDQKYVRLEIRDLTSLPPLTKFTLRRAEFSQEKMLYENFSANKKTANAIGIENTEMIKDDFLMPLTMAHAKGKFEYLDFNVKPSHVYAYWLTKNKTEVVDGPFLIKVRDPKVWVSQATIEAKMAELQKTYPQLAKVVKFGSTFQKRDMNAIIIGNPKNAVLMVGNTHAGESGAEPSIYAAERILNEERDLLKKVGLIVVPVLNIDSRERLINGHMNYIRKNANTVDLNRNFDAGWDVVEERYGTSTDKPTAGSYRGPAPNSEPETRAMIKFLNDYTPKVGFFYHQLGDGFQYNKETEHLYDAVVSFGTTYYRGYKDDPSAVAGKNILQPEKYPGSTQRYCAEKLNIVCITVESQWNARTPAQLRNSNDINTPEDMRAFEIEHYRGILAVMKSLQ
jgi:murein tripeptide amidase MpaA